ncbi:hypothetical protein GIB67_034519 [Kingdonia uniflora]|uniref:Peroxisomal ATPase PEX1 n=1 Tax=Kingdonia uniflora TaxID=39325 RepID=A0A7J7PB54_9MAGN|nr:hypothetical protein GIB67_034519 [Kingdonia uniflora]
MGLEGFSSCNGGFRYEEALGRYNKLNKPRNISRSDRRYSSYLTRVHDSLLRRVLKGQNYLKIYSYHYLINGFSGLVTPQQLSLSLKLKSMELEVKIVTTMEACFVSLPLFLIQTLQSTHSSVLPPILSLELRSRNHDLWHVAWSGSASTSSAIEVAKPLAECISLPDHLTVQVRAVGNLPKATIVTIEPNDVDDWEVLELNAELAEDAILKQVGIVHEGMKFPLWLHGHTVVMFLVVSTFPKKSVVQLVPGTEVAVAPKRRRTSVNSHRDSHTQGSRKEKSLTKALLRVQGPTKDWVHRCEVKGIDLSVVLTSVAFIHPETANHSKLSNHQLIIIFRKSLPKEDMKIAKTITRKSSSAAKDGAVSSFTDKEPTRHTIVHLLLSESVAKGHVMLPHSLRLYLRATLHSWIYVKEYDVPPQKDIPPLKLSPCRFKLYRKDEALKENGSNFPEKNRNRRMKNMAFRTNMFDNDGLMDWSTHEELVVSLSSQKSNFEVEEVTSQFCDTKVLQSFLHVWLNGQIEAIAANTGVNVSSLVLGNQSLLHFLVNGHKFGTSRKEQAPCGGSSEYKQRSGEQPVELLYVLTPVESSDFGHYGCYEITKDEIKSTDDLKLSQQPFGKLDLGDPVYCDSIKEETLDKRLGCTISSLSWMETATCQVIERLRLLLSPTYGKLFRTYNLPLPGHVLIYGPPGSGKTLLGTAVAKSFEEHEEILAHIVLISCSSLALEKAPATKKAITGYISEALDHSPSLVIFDDLDSIISSSSDSEGSQPSTSTTALMEFLTDIMDEYGDKRQSACGYGPIAFVATAQSLDSIPQSLSSSGRFDFHVQLPAPAASERRAILKHEIQKRSLQCSEDILSDIGSSCDGYDAYDLEILVDRAVHAAVGRFLSSDANVEDIEKPVLVREDFKQAMHSFLPVAMRGITKSASEGGRTGWEDVGGLIDIRKSIQEMIELPSKFPNIFAQAPLRLRSNVLLYGPPGCGKTHIVGAAAAACSLRFISVKGPELLNKYIGASEQAVRDIFSKAAAAAPCLLFFDEFDSIAPKRGHDNTGVTDRVVNQFLTELDGVEVLTGVFVFAATSRPDLLDAALLRPGRLDRLLFCDFPSQRERVDILTVLSKKVSVSI